MNYCDHSRSVVRPSTTLNNFFETPGPIFFKFLLEPIVNRGLKIVQMVSVRRTRWLPCPYMLKHLKIFSKTKKASRLNIVYSIRNSRSTNFVQTVRSNLSYNTYNFNARALRKFSHYV